MSSEPALNVAQGGARQFDDRGVEFHLHDLLDAGLAQQFAGCQSVAATEHQHRTRAIGDCRVDQAFGVAVFVAGAELQTSVQVEAQVIAAAGDHDFLVGAVSVGDDRVGVELLAAGGLNVVGMHQQCGDQPERRGGAHKAVTSCRPDTTWRSRKIDTTPAAARLTMPVTAAPRIIPNCGSSRNGQASPPTNAPR